MPAEDKIHPQVRNSLIKEGWTITDEPYLIEYKSDRLFADIRAERMKDGSTTQVLIVEVKSFVQKSVIHALEDTL